MDYFAAAFAPFVTEIYLIYGMAFLFMAAAISLQPKDDQLLPFASDLVWLACFGLLHGAKELFDGLMLLFALDDWGWHVVNKSLLTASFYALFEFARRFAVLLWPTGWFGRLVANPWLIRLLLLAALVWGLMAPQPLPALGSAVRYLVGWPAATLSGVAFLSYEARNVQALRAVRLNSVLRLAGIAMISYGLASGWIVNYPLIASPWWLSARDFLTVTGWPVELLRTACALALALAMGRMLYRVNLEKHHRERAASAQLAEINARLEQQVALRTAQLQQKNDDLLQEIAERQRVEQTLREAQDNLHRAQRVGRIGSWYLYPADNRLEWSQETYRLFGMPVGQPLTYREFLQAVHPDDRELVDRAWRAALTGATYDVVHRICVNGQQKWVHERAEMEFDDYHRLKWVIGTVQDITELREAQLALEASLARLQQSEQRQRELRRIAQIEQSRMAALLSAMNIGILFEDKNGTIEYVNPAFRYMWAIDGDQDPVGRPLRFVLEHTTHQLARPDHASKHVLRVIDTHETSERFEINLYDGRVLTQVSYPVTDPEGGLLGRLWIYEDITNERQTAEQLLYLAEHDPLTGLFNRHRFQENLEQRIALARRGGERFALIYFDLDEFKSINDNFGHRAGDTVLVRVAGEISIVMRDIETFARLGGDEFAILAHVHPHTDLSALPARITQTIAAIPFRFRGANLRLTASIGVAVFPEHGECVEDLIAHADTAMYQAKTLGKNTWAIYDPQKDQSSQAMERMTWRQRIDHALQQGWLELHFQGIYHVENSALSHCEVLVRMRDPQHPEQLIMPGQFIPVAENSGQILEIDRWVLTRSIELLKANPDLPSLAVNISGRSFDDPGLPQRIRKQLEECGVAPNRLLIELTETAAVSDIRDAQRFIEAIRQTGCSVCLDDFGSGFSTFAYLKYLEVDILKIDGLFIRDLPSNRENQIFVRAMTSIAKGLGKTILAEFVEDVATLAMLREFGVDLAQGYYLGRPTVDYRQLLAMAVSCRQ